MQHEDTTVWNGRQLQHSTDTPLRPAFCGSLAPRSKRFYLSSTVSPWLFDRHPKYLISKPWLLFSESIMMCVPVVQVHVLYVPCTYLPGVLCAYYCCTLGAHAAAVYFSADLRFSMLSRLGHIVQMPVIAHHAHEYMTV